MYITPMIAILAVLVAGGVGFILGFGFGGAMSESARSEERSVGYQAGYRAASEKAKP